MSIQQVPPAPPPVERLEVVPTVAVGGYNYRAVAGVWLVVGIVDVLIAVRFLLKLLGASIQSGFVSGIYGVTAPLLAPFHGIFPTSSAAGSVFEPAALVAIAIYSLLGWGVVALIRITTAPRGTPPARS